MTSLKPRQERFCRHFIECANAAQSARAAGYRPESARNTGHRLLKQPHILQRIAELQANIAEEQCRDVDALLSKLETVYRRAIDDHQLSAAARAIELQAKLSGIGGLSRSAREPNRGPMAVSVSDDADPTAKRDSDR